MSRETRVLRREIRREAIDFLREHPGVGRAELKEHLEDEFGGLAGVPGADWQAILAMILEIVNLLMRFIG